MKNFTLQLPEKTLTFEIEEKENCGLGYFNIHFDGRCVGTVLTEDRIEPFCRDYDRFGNWQERVNCRFD